MHRYLFTLIGLLLFTSAPAQTKKPQDFGFRHLNISFQQDPVNVLVLSQPGEEQKKKPVFLFVQGSMPVPLIIYDEQSLYGTFPFQTKDLLPHYHLVIIGKPFIPVVMEASQLQPNFTYLDPDTGKTPEEYNQRNLLEYYVARNQHVIKHLKSLPWVSANQLIVAGHSEGSTIAAKLAETTQEVTQLIYSGGNPMGRIMSMLGQTRAYSDSLAEQLFASWHKIVQDSASMVSSGGDTPKTTYDFSVPPFEYLNKVEIPVMVSYGTKDVAAPFNDYLRVEMIRQHKNNFTFLALAGLEHNYFGLTDKGEIDYDNYNWDKVADQWLEWLLQQPVK